MKTILVLALACFVVQGLYAQPSDTLKMKERRFMKGVSWEWRIENWDSNKNCDLVVNYNFYPDGVFIKYQRVETPTKPYNEVKTVGRWVKEGVDVKFSVEHEGIRTEGEFNSEISPTVFKIKTSKAGQLLKSTNQEFKKLPFMKIFEF